MKRSVTLFLAILLSTAGSSAQDIEPARSSGISVMSQPAGAEVWIGGKFIGRTPLEIQGGHDDTLLLYHPSRSVWRAAHAAAAPPHPDGRVGVVRVLLPEQARVGSLPSGAAVFADDSLCGYTPLIVCPQGEKRFILSYPGYRDTVVAEFGPDENPADRFVAMSPHLEGAGVTEIIRNPSGFRAPSSGVLLTSGLALGAGIAAVALKQHADRRYDAYLASGDRGMLEEARRYDLFSGIGLAFLQAGIAYLVYLLLIDG